MHLTAEKIFWIISVFAILGAGGAGLRARQVQVNDPCYGGQYGATYEECVECIGNENYCASVFGAPGEEVEEEPTATPVPDVYCNNYANDYQTCLDCINQTYCDEIFRRGGQGVSPQPKASTPTPTSQSKSTTKPTPTATSTPTPTATPTPTVNCNEYTQNYQICLACINQAFCDQLFD